MRYDVRHLRPCLPPSARSATCAWLDDDTTKPLAQILADLAAVEHRAQQLDIAADLLAIRGRFIDAENVRAEAVELRLN